MPPPPATAPLTWSLVVPVKMLARAKTRLASLAGPDRPALALAMAAAPVAAALDCPQGGRGIVGPEPPFRPRFGPGSAARHRAAGAAEIPRPGLAGLRRDVDEPADLRGARELGLGTRTAAVAARLGSRQAGGQHE